jgi:1L-myo-inositol 1-phosphate cytidylyltransferase / CDP-L-myo-inositol myo-inositolphosphotransferase
MKCLIIAAGQGTRLSGVGDSKPLVPLLGTPLIIRVIETACKGGATVFYVVVGYRSEKVREILTIYAQDSGVVIHFIENDEWWKQNGISVLKARGIIDEPFFLLMSDHIIEASILSRLKEKCSDTRCPFSVVLAVDTRLENNPLVDLDDVTKVRMEVETGNIMGIGKTIPIYNAFDTGIFYCKPALFDALAESVERGDSSLSGGIRVLCSEMKAGVMDIGEASWIDVDNEEMLKKAEILIEDI